MGLFDRQRKVDLVRVFFPLLVFDIIPGNGSDRRAEIVFDEAGKQFVGDIYEAPAVEGFRPTTFLRWSMEVSTFHLIQ